MQVKLLLGVFLVALASASNVAAPVANGTAIERLGMLVASRLPSSGPSSKSMAWTTWAWVDFLEPSLSQLPVQRLLLFRPDRMATLSDSDLDAALRRIKPACKSVGGPVSNKLDALPHRLSTVGYVVHHKRYSGEQDTAPEDLVSS